MPVWQSGYAADCRSATSRFNSGRWLYEWFTRATSKRRTAQQFSEIRRGTKCLEDEKNCIAVLRIQKALSALTEIGELP
jgi:hypothetical protein